jgi:DNA repair photolyase
MKKTHGTKEWADYNVNCIRGCYNNCRYCYAKMMAKRFGRASDNTWKNMTIVKDVLTRNFKKRNGRVMFPSTHDIFDFSPFREACFTVIRKLLDSENEVLITSKPRFNVIAEIASQFIDYQDQIQFRFTITSHDDKLLGFWEPNAPMFDERMASLEYAFRKGFKTSVSIEPFLDRDPTVLIEKVTPFTTESIWIGRMNYISRNTFTKEERPFYQSVRKNYESGNLWKLHNAVKDYPLVRIKDSVRIQLGLP